MVNPCAKNAGEILPGQADTGILHLEPDVPRSMPPDTHANRSRPMVAVLDRLFRIAEEIQENLQNLVLVHNDGRQFLEIPLETYFMTFQAGLDDAQRIHGQVRQEDLLGHSRNLGIILLGRHNGLDVPDMVAEQFQFVQ